MQNRMLIFIKWSMTKYTIDPLQRTLYSISFFFYWRNFWVAHMAWHSIFRMIIFLYFMHKMLRVCIRIQIALKLKDFLVNRVQNSRRHLAILGFFGVTWQPPTRFAERFLFEFPILPVFDILRAKRPVPFIKYMFL